MNAGLQQQQKHQKAYFEDFLEFNENEGTSYLNLWDTMKAVLNRKFIALSASIKKLESSHTSNLKVPLKALENKRKGQREHTKKD